MLDGCGHVIDCGACQAGEVCGGGGPSLCGTAPCMPKTCAGQGKNCGQISDGNIDCGTCPAPGTCENHRCVCTPATCQSLGAQCGTPSDGCGGTLSCGNCASGLVCNQGHCATSCTPTTCAAQGKNCGSISDGCNNSPLDCGSCTAPETCGGAGVVNQCGCTPTTCAQLGASCGSVPDGCGGTLSCGSCPSGQTCGSSHQCCLASCLQNNVNCGHLRDCNGGVDDCNSCIAAGVPVCNANTNQCVPGCGPAGHICPWPMVCYNDSCCTPSCPSGACGVQPDGCGGFINCASCP